MLLRSVSGRKMALAIAKVLQHGCCALFLVTACKWSPMYSRCEHVQSDLACFSHFVLDSESLWS